jgi:hypothetical protein
MHPLTRSDARLARVQWTFASVRLDSLRASRITRYVPAGSPAEGDLSLASGTAPGSTSATAEAARGPIANDPVSMPSSNRSGRFTDLEQGGIAWAQVRAGSPVICKSVGSAYVRSSPGTPPPRARPRSGRCAQSTQGRTTCMAGSFKPWLQSRLQLLAAAEVLR